MHLIYYVDLVFTLLWSKTHLVHQFPYIIYGVIAGCVQFKNIERRICIEGLAGSAYPTGFHVCSRVFAINSFCQYACAARLPHTPGAAEKIGMCQVLMPYGILQRGSNMFLPYNCIKSLGPVFSCRYYIVTH